MTIFLVAAILAFIVTFFFSYKDLLSIIFKHIPISAQYVRIANWFFLSAIFSAIFLFSFSVIYRFAPTSAVPAVPAAPTPTPTPTNNDNVPSSATVTTQLTAELQRIEQIHTNVETILETISGRPTDTELDSVLQSLQQSSAAIDRNVPSFERGAITLSTEIFQRWQKAKDRQVQMGKRAEELRKRLLSYPPPPDNEQQLKNSALEFVRKYYENLNRADVHAVVEMWLTAPRTLPAMVRDSAGARIICSRIAEIDLSNALVRVDATVRNRRSQKTSRYILTFVLQRVDGDWKLYRQTDPKPLIDIANPTCLVDQPE
jgi:hypothetical protein